MGVRPQRNHGTVGNDGDRSLVDAVKVAAGERADSRGTMVALNDEIHSVRGITKAATGRPTLGIQPI